MRHGGHSTVKSASRLSCQGIQLLPASQVDYVGHGFGECFVEMIIAADELDEEIEEVEAVEDAGLAMFCEYHDGEEGLQGRVTCTDGLEFL